MIMSIFSRFFAVSPEGEYAYNKRREIVPLIVEPDYNPDGWLGPLVLNHLYFDFTDDTKFEQKMKELINEIQRRGQCMIQCNVIITTII